MKLAHIIKRLLCDHDWSPHAAEGYTGIGRLTGRTIRFTIITCRCNRCGKTSIHKIK